MTASNLPKVMLLGMYHFDNPNLDYVKTNYDDVLSEKRQREIEVLLDQLTEYAPTHITIEAEPKAMDKWNARYDEYRAGTFELKRSEIYQIGFRLAHKFNHSQLYGVDYRQEMEIDKVVEYAKVNGQGDVIAKFEERIGEYVAQEQAILQSGATISQILRFHNDPSQIDSTYSIYMSQALIGKTGEYIGADDVGGWYTRNLKTFAEISWLANSPDARILVIIGSGHTVLLRHYINLCSHLELVSALDYLK